MYLQSLPQGLAKAWFNDQNFPSSPNSRHSGLFTLETARATAIPSRTQSRWRNGAGIWLAADYRLNRTSGSFLVSGIALIITILGAILYRGLDNSKLPDHHRASQSDVPLPSYVVGELSWRSGTSQHNLHSGSKTPKTPVYKTAISPETSQLCTGS
jgi:hypothetical protein